MPEKNLSEKILGKTRTLTPKEVKALNNGIKEKLHGRYGVYSGTNECDCGGKVEYGCKRNDGAELGGCVECGVLYIDPKGNRMPSIAQSNIIL